MLPLCLVHCCAASEKVPTLNLKPPKPVLLAGEAVVIMEQGCSNELRQTLKLLSRFSKRFLRGSTVDFAWLTIRDDTGTLSILWRLHLPKLLLAVARTFMFFFACSKPFVSKLEPRQTLLNLQP